MNLKKLRTSKNLSLAQAVEWFKFPHKVWKIQYSPISRSALSHYEQGVRKMPKGFMKAYQKHLEGKEKNLLTGE